MFRIIRQLIIKAKLKGKRYYLVILNEVRGNSLEKQSLGLQ